MKKLVIVTTFATVALGAHSAVACDWNHETRANDPAVATAPVTTTTEQTSKAAVPPSTSVASDESARKVADDPTPVVLITDRH
jgi:hypothetical protein